MKLFELQSPAEVTALENHLDRLMAPVGLDVHFSRHFIERILGRDSAITVPEVVDAFSKLKTKYKRKLRAAKKQGNYEALLKDFDNDLNIVFGIQPPPSGKGMGVLSNITIMKKDPNRFRVSQAGGEVLPV